MTLWGGNTKKALFCNIVSLDRIDLGGGGKYFLSIRNIPLTVKPEVWVASSKELLHMKLENTLLLVKLNQKQLNYQH